MRVRESSRAFIINEKDEVLLQQFIFREVIDEKILWVTPGGGIEIGESSEEALKREIYEELGIVIIPDNTDIKLELDVKINGKNETFISRETYYKIFLNSDTPINIELMSQNEKSSFKSWKWFNKNEIHELESKNIVAPKNISKYIWEKC
ncbi:NUDIX domain-containing protein [Staphylococcus americanisciuri]|uniref:NUDIX hydrolase n=1 Tax=Staphylococcus americanisciuri TaxID=2973940 RepID=A0ABT2F3F3_9STAP|nr:NUDIX hydrolase [Staphylococcus americanisciuri]MCS4486917.1 NUDIX hydrolase [Staphylococcus americanisciuri]